ncbi:UNKNOWN [Stylonychia lemnae]|uniref:Uncharacterized protein n=1 Tax=Stylonychia lemnae TaxID=5949 RepID=A0A078A0Y1_STYLE|nr:UNKNOWN [Stylonychia lemnae]|eukprot:CDW75138.1 UNKNOWN [Stylonychia lemnae]
MQFKVDSTPAIVILKYHILKEIIFKLSRLNRDTRQFIQEEFKYIRPDRLITLRFDFYNLRPKPRKIIWIAACMNIVTLIIVNGIDFDYILSILKQFRPDITLNIELESFNDEDMNAEKFMELIGYYKINEVSIVKSTIVLKSSANYLLGPANTFRAVNSAFRFSRFDQILSCQNLKLENCKLTIKINCEKLFANVRRAYLANTSIKDNYLSLFTDALQELVIKKNVVNSGQALKQDLLKKVMQENKPFYKSLKFLSLYGHISEESLLTLLHHQSIFPSLEVIKIHCDQLLLSLSKIKMRMKLHNLKKLDLRGCLVKADVNGQNVLNVPGANIGIQRKGVRMGNLSAMIKHNQQLKTIKKKALGKNYHRVAWQDSPDTSDEEKKARKFEQSSQESDMSDELERARKNYQKRMKGQERYNQKNGFNFEKNLFF